MSAATSKLGSPLGKLTQSWRWSLTYGIACLLLGLGVVCWPGPTLRIVAVLFAVQLIVASVFRFVVALIRTGDGMVQKFQLAAIASFAFVIGMVLLGNPGLSLRLIAIVLGVYWAIHGAIELVEAMTYCSRTERAWVVASGAMGMIVGLILIVAGAFPMNFEALHGRFLMVTRTLGAWLVVYGVIMVVRAFRTLHPATNTASDIRPAST